MAIKSFGVTVKINTILIGGLMEVTPGGRDVNFIDTTSHDSAGGNREFIGGLTDNGTLELGGNFVLADVGQVELREEQGEIAAIIVTFSDLSTSTFSAVVGAFNIGNPLDDKVDFSISLKVTGAIVIAAAP